MAELTMEYNFLGKSGLKVSNIAMGCMTFGQSPDKPSRYSPKPVDEELSHHILDRYAELGGNFLDTADVYVSGISEKIVGSWLSKHERSKFVVATKVRIPVDTSNVNSVGLSRRHIIESCEHSLERLQTPFIDLYQSHSWDSATPIEETLRTFDDLVRCGKIRYFGASNVCGWQMQMIVDRIQEMGLNRCISLQQFYNVFDRQSEFEEFMVCKNVGIGVLPWSPLKGGLLTGKHKRGITPDATKSRIGFVHKDESRALELAPAWSKYANNEEYWILMDTLKEIANSHGKSIAQVSIRWLLQKEVVASVIIGVTSLKQLEDNMGAATGWQLTLEEMQRLDEVSPSMTLYPHEVIMRLNKARHNKFNV